MGLLYTTVVVIVLEEENSPILHWDEVQILEHLVFLYFFNDKVDVRLSVFKVSFLRMEPHLVEVSMNNIEAVLSELVEKLQKRLFH